MQQPSFTAPAVSPASVSLGGTGDPPLSGFVERRGSQGGRARPGMGERRQFGSSHQGLSEEGRELAQAIDRYKLDHHRRYITCDEMLTVIQQLGYTRAHLTSG